MYGSEKTDLVVKYYDQAIGVSGEDEMAWYLGKARVSGGPVLDLACGTGRLALLLAREGFHVTGIDSSEGMLNVFREKLVQEPARVRRRVRIENQVMSSFDLNQAFNTIICCDAFFHNLTAEAQMACLRCVRQHLKPEGRFVFNLPNPTCEYILWSATSAGKEFEERGRFDLKEGSGTVLVEQAQAGNVLDQTIRTTLRITRFDPEGNEVEQGESAWASRYLFRYEAIHLLYRCGFDIVSLVGDYRDGPVTEKGQLVFDTRRSSHGLEATPQG